MQNNNMKKAENLHYPDSELSCVRRLAEKVAIIAHSDRMAAVRKRWRDVNELRRPDRAPVWCRPVGCWSELLPEEMLVCQTPLLRDIEYNLRQVLVKNEIGDDSIVNPWYDVPRHFDLQQANLWGVDIRRHASDTAGGAWGYDPPIKTVNDLALLETPRFCYNAAKTGEILDATATALGQALPVKLRCPMLLPVTVGTAVADLLGLGRMMLLMATEPDTVHKVTRHVADAVWDSNRYLEEEGFLDRNNDTPMTCSDDFGPDPGGDRRLSLANLWCAANSQEYDQVSPEMWREFCLRYQMPLMAEFGRVLYGCCENLTYKIDDVLKIPNLRVFVCSAWTDLEVILEKTGPQHVIMWRRKASEVVMPDTVDGIRKDLQEGTRMLRGRCYQIVLRELQTLAGHHDRLREWTREAVGAAERNS